MQKKVRLFGIPIYSIEHRSINVGSALQPTERLIEALGGKATDAGVAVTGNNITTLSAVWRAVNIISGTLASLPLKLYRNLSDGSREALPAHQLQQLIKAPNGLMTDFIWRESTQAVLMLWGNAYAVIKRDGTGKPVELIPVHPDDVEVYKNDNTLDYNITIDHKTQRVLGSDVLHLMGLSYDGMKGKSVISLSRESVGLSMAAQKFGAKFFGSGANMDGVLEVPGTLNDDTYKRLRDSWDERYTGLEKAHNTAILEGGMKYQRIGIPPEDAQFLQTRQFQVAEVARWFGVQPHLLMDLDRATNNNIEHQGIEFVLFTLTQWVSRWEAELNRKLLPAGMKETHFFEFNLNGLLRGDSKARSDYYRTMFGIGAINNNEIRRLENMQAYPGGDQYYVQAGFAPVNVLEEYYKSKQRKNEGKE